MIVPNIVPASAPPRLRAALFARYHGGGTNSASDRSSQLQLQAGVWSTSWSVAGRNDTAES